MPTLTPELALIITSAVGAAIAATPAALDAVLRHLRERRPTSRTFRSRRGNPRAKSPRPAIAALSWVFILLLMFKATLPVLLLPLALLSAPASAPTRPVSSSIYRPESARVWFSPDGGCTEAIVAELKAAKKSVRVQAYSFTSAPIAAAVVEAHRRGLDVQVILDKSQRSERYSSADFLQHAGVPVFIDDHHAIAHNKVIILDGAAVFTGSFNFSKAAEEKNAENLLLIKDAELAERYLENWQAHREHAQD